MAVMGVGMMGMRMRQGLMPMSMHVRPLDCSIMLMLMMLVVNMFM